jgi:predicted metal-dependent peptidase
VPKTTKKSNEKEVIDAFNKTLESFKVTREEYNIFKQDIETVCYKFSLDFPFWGVLSERCSFSLTKHLVPTAGITKTGHILFNVDFLSRIRQENPKVYGKKFLFLIAHEIAHFAFEHADRQGSRDAMLFNVAADFAINLLLNYQFEGNKDYFIEGGCLDEKYKDMSAEEIYELIKNDSKIKEDFGSGLGEDLMPGLSEEDVGEGGVCVRERRVPLPDLRGKSPEQARQELSDWVGKATNEAFAVAKQQGKMPADFERAVSKWLKPKVDWLRALKQKMRFGISRTEKRDVTWSIPNRRFLGADYIFPSNVGPDKPKIVYAVDTSGSMSDTDLEQAIGELEDIRKKFGAKVYMIDCDANVHGSRWILPHEPLPKLKGGGGTDFCPVFDHLIENRIKPDYCVFFTDGYGSFPDNKPPFSTLWVMTSDVSPPFGEVVRVNVPYEG